MTEREEMLNAPTFSREDLDRVYHALYIIPTSKVSNVSVYPQAILVASYNDDGEEKHVKFDNGSDVVQMNNIEMERLMFFHIDCSYSNMVRLFGFDFIVEQASDTFVIKPV